MRKILSIATIAGAALMVTACGGAATNNTMNASDNMGGETMGNEPMMNDTMAPMPTEGNNMMTPPPAMGNDMGSSNDMMSGNMSNGM